MYVCLFVRPYAGHGQLSSEWRHNENDVIMIIAGVWRYGDWRHVATGCSALVTTKQEQPGLKKLLQLPNNEYNS